MPNARGNQPMSAGSNYNQSAAAKKVVPKKNKAIKYKKGGGKKASYDNKQTSKINALSKQVHKLQMASYGKVQQNFQRLREILVPVATRAICLDLTDFTCNRPGTPSAAEGANVFQYGLTTTTPAAVAHWDLASLNTNVFWKHQNVDQVDGGAYLAMNCTYFVEVQGVDALDNTRVRFDIVSQKPSVLTQQIAGATALTGILTLPDSLNSMQHLADPTVNRINPLYFKKYMSKVVFINSAKSNPDTKGTTANIMRFSFRLKPNKLCIQNKTNPTIGNLDDEPEIARGNFGPYNVPATQPLWMIISTDDEVGVLDAVNIKISRRVVWRDQIGSANL